MKRWTTDAQFEWLTEKIPEWKEVQKRKEIQDWLVRTTNDFLKAFPEFVRWDVSKLNQKIREWFGNHSRSSAKRDAPPIPLRRVKKRKPVPLLPHQAYSKVFCVPGSDLHRTLRDEHKLYLSGDPATVSKYSHYFKSGVMDKRMKFVTFQQPILRERVKNATEEELAAIKAFVETELEKATTAQERPWSNLPGQSESEKKRNYIASQVDALPESVQAALDEIKKHVGFNAYVILGGPSATGTGAISFQTLQSGHSLDTGQTFEEFLGPMHRDVKNKFIDWLHTTYTKEELHRTDLAENPSSATLHMFSDEPPLLPASSRRTSPPAHPTPRRRLRSSRRRQPSLPSGVDEMDEGQAPDQDMIDLDEEEDRWKVRDEEDDDDDDDDDEDGWKDKGEEEDEEEEDEDDEDEDDEDEDDEDEDDEDEDDEDEDEGGDADRQASSPLPPNGRSLKLLPARNPSPSQHTSSDQRVPSIRPKFLFDGVVLRPPPDHFREMWRMFETRNN